MRRIGLIVGLMAALGIAFPALAQQEPSHVEVHVSDRSPAIEEPVQITVHVFSSNGDPVNSADPNALVEIRTVPVSEEPILPVWDRVGEGIYETSLTFNTPGDRILTVLPDSEDQGSPLFAFDDIRIDVRNPTAGTIAVLALIGGGVVIAVLAGPWLRRPKGQPKAGPTGHDTWWASP